MNRLFDEVLRGGPVATQAGRGSGMLLAPNMDVSESDKEVRIQAELPGVQEKDLELALNDGVLTLRAEKKQERKEEREGVHFSERSYGTFQRALRLPFHVNPDQVQAHFENGVLTVTLPKAPQQEKSRRIQVQGPGAQPGNQSMIAQDQEKHDGQGAVAATTSGDGQGATPTAAT